MPDTLDNLLSLVSSRLVSDTMRESYITNVKIFLQNGELSKNRFSWILSEISLYKISVKKYDKEESIKLLQAHGLLKEANYYFDHVKTSIKKPDMFELKWKQKAEEYKGRIEILEQKVSQLERHDAQRNKTSFKIITFTLLRLLRGACGVVMGFQIIALLPVLTWVINPPVITDNIMNLITLRIILLVVFSLMFVELRKIIHKLHNRWYGSPHPKLLKTLAL